MEVRATTARQIDKTAVTESQVTALHDRSGALLSGTAEDAMAAGDFYFRTQVQIHHETASWFRRVILRQKQKLITKSFLSVVMSCPFCGLPILTPIGTISSKPSA